LNSVTEKKLALLFISVLLLVLVVPFMSGKFMIILSVILIALMLGVFRILNLSSPLMIGSASIGVLAAILHFSTIMYGDFFW